MWKCSRCFPSRCSRTGDSSMDGDLMTRLSNGSSPSSTHQHPAIQRGTRVTYVEPRANEHRGRTHVLGAPSPDRPQAPRALPATPSARGGASDTWAIETDGLS